MGFGFKPAPWHGTGKGGGAGKIIIYLHLFGAARASGHPGSLWQNDKQTTSKQAKSNKCQCSGPFIINSFRDWDLLSDVWSSTTTPPPAPLPPHCCPAPYVSLSPIFISVPSLPFSPATTTLLTSLPFPPCM